MSVFYCTEGSYQNKNLSEAYDIQTHAYCGGSNDYRSTFYFRPNENFLSPIRLTSASFSASTANGAEGTYFLYITTNKKPFGTDLSKVVQAGEITFDKINNTYRHSTEFSEEALTLISEYINTNQKWYLIIANKDEKYCDIAGYNNQTYTKEPKFTFEWEYGRSTGLLNKTNYQMGEEIYFTINSLNSNYKHKIKLSINNVVLTEQELNSEELNYTYLLTTDNIISSYFPKDKKITNGLLTLSTFLEDEEIVDIGKVDYPFTIQLKSDTFLPIISKIDEKDIFFPHYYKNVRETIDFFISNYSFLGWNFSIKPALNTEIKYYTIIASGAQTFTQQFSVNSSSSPINVSGNYNSYISKGGNLNVTISVVDSRGQTSFYEEIIEIKQYNKPYFSNINYYRADEEGKLNLIGPYLIGSANYNICEISIEDKNFINHYTELSLQVFQNSETALISKTNSLELTVQDFTGDKKFNTSQGQIIISVTDNVLTEASSFTINIAPANYIMHFRKGGTALAFGGVASEEQEDNTINSYWKLNLKSNPLDLDSGGTSASSREGAFIKIVEPGGIINKLTIKDNESSLNKNRPFLELIPYQFQEDNSHKDCGLVRLYGGYGIKDSKVYNTWSDLEVWDNAEGSQKGSLTLYKQHEKIPELKMGYYKDQIWTEYDVMLMKHEDSPTKRIILTKDLSELEDWSNDSNSYIVDIPFSITSFQKIINVFGIIHSKELTDYSEDQESIAGKRPNYVYIIPNGWINTFTDSENWSIGLHYNSKINSFRINFPKAFSHASEWSEIKKSMIILTIDYIP